MLSQITSENNIVLEYHIFLYDMEWILTKPLHNFTRQTHSCLWKSLMARLALLTFVMLLIHGSLLRYEKILYSRTNQNFVVNVLSCVTDQEKGKLPRDALIFIWIYWLSAV